MDAFTVIRPFTVADQAVVRDLILSGLGSRFGFIDASFNPDLDDIHANYVAQGATVLVTENLNAIVGCGILMREDGSELIGRIVRMSVATSEQGKGLGRRIGEALLRVAQERGFQRVLVETNDDWHSALRLYQSLGFHEERRAVSPEFGFVEVHMALEL
ncbi:MAG: GNAT family N-acetyltransferase [Anaerolineae bacterium]